MGLGGTDAEPTEWQPVTADNVFTYSQSANWDVGDAEMTAAASDPILFLNTFAWAAWSYDHDEASWQELHESFEASLKAMIRRLLGNCVAATFNVQDVVPFFKQDGSRVATITYIYAEPAGIPEAIRATSQHGETVELKLVA